MNAMSERLDIEGMLCHIYVDSIDIIRFQSASLFYYKNSDDKTMTSMTVTLVIAIRFHFLILKTYLYLLTLLSMSISASDEESESSHEVSISNRNKRERNTLCQRSIRAAKKIKVSALGRQCVFVLQK